MSLYFITGNEKKVRELQAIIPQVEMLSLDLPEIQSNDAHEIIRYKLQEALKHHDGAILVEDTSLYLDALNGLPGPLIKWFLEALGYEGLANLTHKLGNNRAVGKTIIGYAKNTSEVAFFEGAITGTIVSPRKDAGFGWDPIFKPDGYTQTFGELGHEEKIKISMRTQAAHKLAAYLQRQEA